MSLTIAESAAAYKKSVTAKYTPSPLGDPRVKEEVERLMKEKKREDYKVLSLKALQEYECPNYTWRVQNLLQDKKIIIVAGSSAVYKSWLCLAVGLSVAKGVPFLDNFAVEQGGVLFIDRENSIPELQNRVEMVSKGMGIKEEEELPLHFLSEQSLMLDRPEARDFLESFIEENDIKLVVVDTYRRVISFEENDANSVSFFFTECLKPICEKTGASFVFIHHHKKGKHEGNEKEMLRGSSDLVNFVDGVIQISRKGERITVKQTKNRSGKELDPFDLQIETDEEEYFKFKYTGEKRDISRIGKVVEILMVWFGKDKIKEFTTKEGRNICLSNGFKKQRYFEGIEELIKRNVIEKIGHGKYSIVHMAGGLSKTAKSKTAKSSRKSGDFSKVHSPSYKKRGLSGLLDKSKSTKSTKSKRTIGTIGTIKEDSTRDLQYFEDPVCNNIKDCNLDEVLKYTKKNPKVKIPKLIELFGSGVMKLKREGLIQ